MKAVDRAVNHVAVWRARGLARRVVQRQRIRKMLFDLSIDSSVDPIAELVQTARKGEELLASAYRAAERARTELHDAETQLAIANAARSAAYIAGVYDQGGWLPPGLTLARNFTGKPERVGSGEQRINVGPSIDEAEVERKIDEANGRAERELLSDVVRDAPRARVRDVLFGLAGVDLTPDEAEWAKRYVDTRVRQRPCVVCGKPALPGSDYCYRHPEPRPTARELAFADQLRDSIRAAIKDAVHLYARPTAGHSRVVVERLQGDIERLTDRVLNEAEGAEPNDRKDGTA